MQGTATESIIQKKSKRRLNKFMPCAGLSLDLSVLGTPYDRNEAERYISRFLEREATWIDLYEPPVIGEDLHLISKAHVLNSSLINNDGYYDSFLEGLLKEIGMTKIRGPFTDRVGDNPSMSGLTSLALGDTYTNGPLVIRSVVGLRESRADIHAWPESLYFTIGIHSCKLFDASRALAYTADYFGVNNFDKLHLIKG